MLKFYLYLQTNINNFVKIFLYDKRIDMKIHLTLIKIGVLPIAKNFWILDLSMIIILSHALKHFTRYTNFFTHSIRFTSSHQKMPIQWNPFALSNPSHSRFARRDIASFTTSRVSPAVSIILTRLADFVVKRMCLPWELDNPTLRHTGSAYESPSGRFTDRYWRAHYDKSRLRFGRRTDQTKSNYPPSLVSGKSPYTCGARRRRGAGPFNGLVSSNKLNRSRIVRRAISTAIQKRKGARPKGPEKSRRDQRLP